MHFEDSENDTKELEDEIINNDDIPSYPRTRPRPANHPEDKTEE